MAGISFAKTVADCELLKTALEPMLQDLPHLTPEHAELETFLSGIKAMNARQKDLTGELRQITRQRQEAEKKGQDLRSRVAAQVRGKLGFKNEQLLKLGLALRRKRRKKAEEPPVATPPAEPVSKTAQ
jgi:predicted AAA+ superfamily ATPase